MAPEPFRAGPVFIEGREVETGAWRGTITGGEVES